MNEFILIAGMAFVTYMTRYPLLALFGRISLPTPIFRALKYVPPAVLTAIIVPAIFMPGGQISLSLYNAHLIGATVATLVAWKTRSLLWTILLGMLVFLLMQGFMN